MRSLLLLVVLIPTIGMVMISTIAASRARDERNAAHRLVEGVTELLAIVDARAAIADEEVVSSVLTIAADLGASAQEVGEIYGVDYLGQLAEARVAVDNDPVLSADPTLADSLDALRALRPGITRGSVAFDELYPIIRAVRDDIDQVWHDQFQLQAGDEVASRLPANVHASLAAVNDTYLALSAGSNRATLAIQVFTGDAAMDDTAALMDAKSRFAAAVDRFQDDLGPGAATAWRAFTEDPASQRFTHTLEEAEQSALSGEPSPLAGDPSAFGDALIDGDPWAARLTEIVRGAADDLSEISRGQAADASGDLRLLEGVSIVLTILSLAGAVVLARVVTQPIERLEEAAQQVHAGRFDLAPLRVRGPRELADTAAAFNDMARTLAAVEAQAVALADDPEAQVTGDQLPGRTGRALQVALNRLRSSIQVAERHRRELQRAATHDDLTGLLNRSAAVEVIERDLARVAREGGVVLALFLDLDGLKEINDQHGHAAGDDALRLVADALGAATRSTDVVARLSGDEFLVSGIAHDVPGEIDALADRVHNAVSEQVLVCASQEIRLRCSVGVALATESDTALSLINKADAGLYTAKRQGRNRIVWHEDPESAREADRP